MYIPSGESDCAAASQLRIRTGSGGVLQINRKGVLGRGQPWGTWTLSTSVKLETLAWITALVLEQLSEYSAVTWGPW